MILIGQFFAVGSPCSAYSVKNCILIMAEEVCLSNIFLYICSDIQFFPCNFQNMMAVMLRVGKKTLLKIMESLNMWNFYLTQLWNR